VFIPFSAQEAAMKYMGGLISDVVKIRQNIEKQDRVESMEWQKYLEQREKRLLEKVSHKHRKKQSRLVGLTYRPHF